jgi:phosphoribosylaminoimidazole-succinocarboxamide synthase
MSAAMLESDLPGLTYRGKVRDTYDLGDRLLIVATDRISAFDVVLPTAVARKGEVLTRLSAWWFERVARVVPTHFIAVVDAQNAGEVPLPLDERYYGRSMLVRKAKRIDAECIVRGYLSGSAWKEYQLTGAVCGITLPEGLRESEQLAEPIFTPSTKPEVGHDQNVTFEDFAVIVGEDTANAARVRSLAVYGYAQQVARERGVIIADTKFEFGMWNEEVILIDEALTPDSSRFWPLEGYRAGGPQPSLDKQPVRDWMASSGWEDGDTPPQMPADVVAATTARYLAVYKMLTGEELPG